MNQHLQVVIVLDQGTTSTKAMAFDVQGKNIAQHSETTQSFFPFNDAVEQDPITIYNNSLLCLEKVVAKLEDCQILGIAIANQRETTVIWNRLTGEPVYPAIIWNDSRTTQMCEEIKQQHQQLFLDRTGLTVSAYFSASKAKWILDSDAAIAELANKGYLAFGTIDSWLLYKFTQSHLMEISNASRTLLFDIHRCQFDPELMQIFGLNENILPRVVASDYDFGTIQISGTDYPILAVLGDQQASLHGHQCFFSGEAKSTYGTGNFYMVNTGASCLPSEAGLINTIAWQKNGVLTYAQEGSAFYAGALIDWLKDTLHLFSQWSELENLLITEDYEQSVWLIPAFGGLGSPWWNARVKAAIIGMQQGANKQQIINAAFHAIAHQSADLLEASILPIKSLQVDGKMANNSKFAQILANVTGISITVPVNVEMTAWGVANLAFEKLQISQGNDAGQIHADIDQSNDGPKHYAAQWSAEYLSKTRARWKKTVQSLIDAQF